jgi:hypothetical protein
MGVNKHIVWNERLKKLPEFEPEEKLWAKIEAELDFDIKFNSAISQLPTFVPNELLWEKLEKKIPKQRTIRFHHWQWGVAVSVLIVVSLLVFLFQNPSKQNLIIENEIITTEVEPTFNLTEASDYKALALINELCETNKTICNGTVFNEKITLFNELEQQEALLQKTISSIGESPEIVKALIRIENMKSKTIQELVTLINS